MAQAIGLVELKESLESSSLELRELSDQEVQRLKSRALVHLSVALSNELHLVVFVGREMMRQMRRIEGR